MIAYVATATFGAMNVMHHTLLRMAPNLRGLLSRHSSCCLWQSFSCYHDSDFLAVGECAETQVRCSKYETLGASHGVRGIWLDTSRRATRVRIQQRVPHVPHYGFSQSKVNRNSRRLVSERPETGRVRPDPVMPIAEKLSFVSRLASRTHNNAYGSLSRVVSTPLRSDVGRYPAPGPREIDAVGMTGCPAG